MKSLKLSQGKNTIVDDFDYEYLSKFKWCITNNGYAGRNCGESRKRLLMHREIVKPPLGMDIDHINGNKLDNRRSNLRIATRSENMRNSKKRIDNSSGFKGVVFYKRDKNWRAYIKINYKQIHLGYFDTAMKAARAYDNAAILYSGIFAKTNE